MHLAGAGLTCNYLIVEAKNRETNRGEAVHQLNRYLGRWTIATVGLLLTRRSLSATIRKQIIDHRRIAQGLTAIVPLDDSVLITMLDNARVGRFDLNETLLISLLDDVIYDTH